MKQSWRRNLTKLAIGASYFAAGYMGAKAAGALLDTDAGSNDGRERAAIVAPCRDAVIDGDWYAECSHAQHRIQPHGDGYICRCPHGSDAGAAHQGE